MFNGMFVLAAVAVSGLALAGEPVPDAKPLATVEAILDYCAKVDPAAAERYQEHVKLVAQGASEETLAKVRKSNEYQQAHGEVDEFLAKVDPHNAKKVCSQQLGQTQ